MGNQAIKIWDINRLTHNLRGEPKKWIRCSCTCLDHAANLPSPLKQARTNAGGFGEAVRVQADQTKT